LTPSEQEKFGVRYTNRRNCLATVVPKYKNIVKSHNRNTLRATATEKSGRGKIKSGQIE
jgi:hypothetical protein